MKQNAWIRKWLAPLKKTPFHPQWFVFKDEQKTLTEIGGYASGNVLDIGAGTQEISNYLGGTCRYISLDYYQTATEWYRTTPQIFGDGQALPFRTESMDTVLLLDVLEHLPDPERCVAEVRRVLRPGGKFVVQVPFLYPLHDTPYDFRRWTRFGLEKLAQTYNFQIEVEKSLSHPLESAAMLANLALSKTVLNWLQRGNPLSLLLLPLPLVILRNNLFAWILARLSAQEVFMPAGYRMVWVKPA